MPQAYRTVVSSDWVRDIKVAGSLPVTDSPSPLGLMQLTTYRRDASTLSICPSVCASLLHTSSSVCRILDGKMEISLPDAKNPIVSTVPSRTLQKPAPPGLRQTRSCNTLHYGQQTYPYIGLLRGKSKLIQGS
jgi:hypothetical protein